MEEEEKSSSRIQRRFGYLIYGHVSCQRKRVRSICSLCQYRWFQPRTVEDKRRKRLQAGRQRIRHPRRDAGILRKELEIHGIRQRTA